MSFLDEKKLDPVGKENDDINNDGKVDKTDKYLKNRREKIAKNLKEEDLEEGKLKNFVLGLGLSAAALAGISNMNNNDPVVKRLKAEYEQAEPAKQDSIKKLITKRLIFLDTGKFDDNTPMKEDKKTVELPADTTFTLDLKHLMKKHLDEGKSQEDVVKLTKALMKKLHDKGEVTVKGTKVLFKESAASNLELKSLAKKIYLTMKKLLPGRVQLVGNVSTAPDDTGWGKRLDAGRVDDLDKPYAAIFINTSNNREDNKESVHVQLGAPKKEQALKVYNDLKSAYPQFEYEHVQQKQGIGWSRNGYYIQWLIRPGKTTSEADVPQDTQLALPEPPARDYLGDDGKDYEGGMAKSQMLKMKKYAAALCDMIDDESQLESWVQAKLTKASEYMSAVYHYLDYQKSKMNEAIGDVIPDGEWQKLDIEWIMDEPDVNRPDYQEGPLYGTTADGRAFESYGNWTPFEDEYLPLRGEEVVEIPLP